MTPGTEQRKLAVILFTDMVGYLAGLGARFLEHALLCRASILYKYSDQTHTAAA